MRPTIVAATLLLISLPLSAQDSLTLSFAWPAGLSGVVTESTTMSQTAMGMSNEQRTVTRRRIETQDHPSGLLIRYLEGELLESSAPGMAAIEGGDDFTRLVAEAPYDMVVDDAGEIVEITRDPATLDSLRAGMERMLEPMRGTPGAEAMTAMLENSMSGEAMNAAIAQNWSSSVGLWRGDEATIGEMYMSEQEVPFPLLENRTLLMQLSTTVLERLPCTEGGAPGRCVRIVVESTMDPSDFRPLMEEMMGDMLAGLPPEVSLDFGEMDMTTTVEAIVEANSLLPHRVTMTTGGDIEMIMMGQTMKTTQEMASTMTYEWQGR